MKNDFISPRFTEASYKGQDVVHFGIRIPLGMEPAEALKKFSRRTQRILDHGVEPGVRFVDLEEKHLDGLRNMWFDPKDETFPATMDGHTGIVAIDADGVIVGGAIWAESGNQLFLHQLVSGEWGKKHQIPTHLVWQSVVKYHKKYYALDIGVSYNPKRYEFFKNFEVETYPIILKAPLERPLIRMTPFKSYERMAEELNEVQSDTPSKIIDNATYFPRASYALYALLKHLKLEPQDTVLIVKTFGSKYVPACVTQQIEKVCNWKLHNYNTWDPSEVKMVLVIHEFGLPMKQFLGMLTQFKNAGVPIVEDCAWRQNNVLDSDYQIYSMSKLLPVNYGGLLLGVKMTDEYLWSIGCFDFVKRNLFLGSRNRMVELGKRERNWKQYHKYVVDDGMTPDDCYKYEEVIKNKEWVPTIYLQRFKDDAEADAIVARLEEFGIQAMRYHGEPVVGLPIHEQSEGDVEYMFAVVRGYFNLCRDYGKK